MYGEWRYISTHYHRMFWHSDNALDSYSVRLQFESRPGHRSFWMKIFVVTLSPSRQIPGQHICYTKTVSFQTLPSHNSPIIPTFSATQTQGTYHLFWTVYIQTESTCLICIPVKQQLVKCVTDCLLSCTTFVVSCLFQNSEA